MTKINYKDFLDDLLNRGAVIKGSHFFDYLGHDFYSLKSNKKDVDAIRAKLMTGGGDVIEVDGIYYSVTCDIVSNKTFSVTGFTGDMDAFVKGAIESLKKDVNHLIDAVSSYDKISVRFSKSSYDCAFPIRAADAARDLARHWIVQAYDYIELRMAYNLLDRKSSNEFVCDDVSTVWQRILGHRRFHDTFKSFDDLLKLPQMMNFEKLLKRTQDNFNEDELNANSFDKACWGLAATYINKAKHNAFDKYKLTYSLGWTYSDFGFSHFADWFDAFGLCCFDQGDVEFFRRFESQVKEQLPNASVGSSFICAGVKIHRYKGHITLSLPKNISMMIGLFINKHGPDVIESYMGGNRSRSY